MEQRYIEKRLGNTSKASERLADGARSIYQTSLASWLLASTTSGSKGRNDYGARRMQLGLCLDFRVLETKKFSPRLRLTQSSETAAAISDEHGMHAWFPSC